MTLDSTKVFCSEHEITPFSAIGAILWLCSIFMKEKRANTAGNSNSTITRLVFPVDCRTELGWGSSYVGNAVSQAIAELPKGTLLPSTVTEPSTHERTEILIEAARKIREATEQTRSTATSYLAFLAADRNKHKQVLWDPAYPDTTYITGWHEFSLYKEWRFDSSRTKKPQFVGRPDCPDDPGYCMLLPHYDEDKLQLLVHFSPEDDVQRFDTMWRLCWDSIRDEP